MKLPPIIINRRPLKGKKGYVWSEEAFDYSTPIIIYDVVTKDVYSEAEAKAAPKSVQHRLCQRPSSKGAWVMTKSKCKEVLAQRAFKYCGDTSHKSL